MEPSVDDGCSINAGVEMRKLWFPVIAALAMSVAASESASAKGNDFTIIVGGGNLAPYYYAIPGPLPVQGWLGLLANEGDQPGTDQPAGRIADPAGASAMLTASYDVYFDELPEQGAPHASYLPAAASHPAYLYWRAARGGMPYVAWFTLTDPARAYLDDAIKTAVAMKDAGVGNLQTDWLSSAILHGRCCTDEAGISEFVSAQYIISDDAQYGNERIPPHVLSGRDADDLLHAYVSTLHNWHSPAKEETGAAREYTVSTPGGKQVFSFVTATDNSVIRVYVAEGFGGYFDPDPALSALIKSIVPPTTPSGARSSTGATREGSRSQGIVAGALAAGLLLTLGIGAAWAYRSERSMSG
jgi:hypothetical protein